MQDPGPLQEYSHHPADYVTAPGGGIPQEAAAGGVPGISPTSAAGGGGIGEAPLSPAGMSGGVSPAGSPLSPGGPVSPLSPRLMDGIPAHRPPLIDSFGKSVGRIQGRYIDFGSSTRERETADNFYLVQILQLQIIVFHL